MARNGSGTYVLPGAALVDGQTVSATEHNAFRDDVATALTGSIARDGQSPATANLPMGGFKLTGLAAGTGTGESVRYDEFNGHLTDTSAAHAASAISNTPAGNIAATDVQAAINELDTEKAALAGSVSQAFSVASLEIGHASDTTITRASAGTIAVEGVNILTTATGAALAGSASQAFATANLTVTGSALVNSATGLIGYTTGAGGTVTQTTSKTTSVTLNKPTGQITMDAAALGAGASATFTCANSLAGNHLVKADISSTFGTSYRVKASTDGSNIYFTVTNETAGSLSDAVVIKFAIISRATA